ncbi:MAG: hypothetical protein APF80_07060 [Alphaproteobacteria bacterium BRH_c36]|nr:MAG: hypothetical protein APF80_07060 [Alphaproteobacteria bacterium BRH_c36]
MATDTPDNEEAAPKRKRRLRAALAADIANFSGRVSVNETRAFSNLSAILKIGREELTRHDGDLIGMPGDGLFALFESAVDAVQCALKIQERLATQTNLGGMRLRIGIHVGDVLFEGDMPFGETLNIAARLESLADPGGILVSGTMVDAVSARIQATFEDRGVPSLKNIPRRITTFAVHSADRLSDTDMGIPSLPLDTTMQLPRAGSLTAAAAAAEAKKAPEATEKPPQTAAVEKSKPSQLEQTVADPEPLARPKANDAPLVPPAPPSPRQPPVPGQSTSTRSRSATAQPTPPTAAATIPAEAINEITEALAVHLGPVARLMVNRKSKTATSASNLIETLAGELASSDERAKFRTRLIKLIGR